ncbi:hypothetical protein GS446_05390 [Rhodococcus hoagii]|nr:hypothetical protein [Prescottella equi]
MPKKNAPGAGATATEGSENRTNTQEGTDSTVTVPNAARLDDFFVSTIESRAVVDMSVDTENGLDLELDYNWETDEAGELVEAYYRVVFTAHAGNSSSMLQISPHKIPQLVATLNELHDAWKRDIQRTALSGITVESIFLDAQARGLAITEVLAEVLEQLGIAAGKV